MTRQGSDIYADSGKKNGPRQLGGWQAVDVRAWRAGCRPETPIALDLGAYSDDFDFDPNEIGADEAVRFVALIEPHANPAHVRRFAFVGADGNRHWVACTDSNIALEVWATPQKIRSGGDPKWGTEGDESGVFFPEQGLPVGFGRAGQPTLADILSGTFTPAGCKTPLLPEGTFQVDGDDLDFEEFNPSFENTIPGLPKNRAGAAACLPTDAIVVSVDGMVPLAEMAEGACLRTPGHGWQSISWIRWPAKASPQQPVFLATARGIPVSPSHSAGRILLMTGCISSPAARRGAN